MHSRYLHRRSPKVSEPCRTARTKSFCRLPRTISLLAAAALHFCPYRRVLGPPQPAVWLENQRIWSGGCIFPTITIIVEELQQQKKKKNLRFFPSSPHDSHCLSAYFVSSSSRPCCCCCSCLGRRRTKVPITVTCSMARVCLARTLNLSRRVVSVSEFESQCAAYFSVLLFLL